MRYFFRRHLPPVTRILLIESGSRSLLEKVIPSLKAGFGDQVELDLVTCYAGLPAGFEGRVFRVTDYGGGSGRNQLWADLAPRDYPIAGMICAAEPIMTKWKWWLGAKLPSKLFVINENGDYFWLDWGHWRLILAVRAVSGRADRVGRGARAGAAGVVPADADVPGPVRWLGTFQEEAAEHL